MGRFTSADPAVLDSRVTKILPDPQQLNPYTYVRNNPLRFIDSTGQQLAPWDTNYDIAAFDQSMQDFNNAQGFLEKINTFVPLAFDTAAVVIPIVPAFVGPAGRFVRSLGELRIDDAARAVNKLGEVERGITVLGKTGYYEKLAEQLGARKFKISDPIWEKMTDAQRWTANKAFLDQTVKRGDRIILSNTVKDVNKAPGYQFRKELQYLSKEYGYRLNKAGNELIR